MFLVNVFLAFGPVGSYREGREEHGGSGLKDWQMIQEIMIKPREAVPDSQRDWFRWRTNQYRLGINQIICIWFHSYLLFVNATYILTSAQVLYRLTLQHRFLFMEGKGSVYTWQVKIGIFSKHSLCIFHIVKSSALHFPSTCQNLKIHSLFDLRFLAHYFATSCIVLFQNFEASSDVWVLLMIGSSEAHMAMFFPPFQEGSMALCPASKCTVPRALKSGLGLENDFLGTRKDPENISFYMRHLYSVCLSF